MIIAYCLHSHILSQENFIVLRVDYNNYSDDLYNSLQVLLNVSLV